MDLYPAALPRVCLIGTPPHLHEAVTWLQEVSAPEVLSHGVLLTLDAPLSDAQLVILDAEAPEAEEVCRRLKQSLASQHIPVLALFEDEASPRIVQLLDSGATDFIRKSMSRAAFLARIQAHLTSQTLRAIAETRETLLKRALHQQTLDTAAIRDSALDILSTLITARDPDLRRIQTRRRAYLNTLAHQVRRSHPQAHLLSDEAIARLCRSSALQELGRLNGPATGMTPDFLEGDIPNMSNAIRGMQLLDEIETRHGQNIDFLGVAREMIQSRNERWDGSGLPLGLRGDQIPLAARLMALVNAYDDVVGGRLGGDEALHEQACDLIITGQSQAFDPDVVVAFIEAAEEFRLIALGHADQAPALLPSRRQDVTTPAHSSAPAIPPAAPGKDALLQELDARLDRLPDPIALFVITLLANSKLLPRNLSDYIVMKLVRRVPLNLGPVHLTFAKMVNAQIEKSEPALAHYPDHLAMLQACGSSSAAVQALNFIVELASLHPPSQEAPGIPRPAND
ncbi:MAG: HD domain-containing phosphohydrolase [Curvibacter sp.]